MDKLLGIVALILLLSGCGSGSNGTSAVTEDPVVNTDTETSDGLNQNTGADCSMGNIVNGEATYYDATGVGNCSFEATTDNMLVAALNTADYGNAEWCGTCAEVMGPLGTVTVKIVDRCPGCASGDIDLSGTAFSQIANPSDGRVPITWKFVACDVVGDVSVRFKTGSNQWWSGVQVRNHRHPISSLEYQGSAGEFIPVDRKRYNYFVAEDGMGVGPVSFRVTDFFGQQIVLDNVAVTPDIDQSAGEQFETCEP